MSTEINIKKRITVLEESAIITADVNSIDFVGSGVNASSVGGDVTVTIPGSSGNTTYYLNESVTQTPYKEFSSIVTSAIEQVVPLTVAGGVTSVIAEYQTPSGVPGTTQIPGGLWQFFLHFNAGAAGQNWIIRPTVYKRDLGGIETLLFTPDPEIVTGMSTTTTMYVSDGVFPATTLLTTDRIVVKISMQNTTGVSQTVNFRTEGSQHYSVGLTTLNQVIPTGAVTSVTGTAPVVSSGGTTPAISIPQATGAVDGYLSSSDFAVFNAKVGGSGTLNYVSKFTGTGTIGNSQTQDNGANIAVNGAIVSAYKFAVYSTTPGENYNIYGNTTVNGAVGITGVNQGVGASTNYGASASAQNSTTKNIGIYSAADGPSAENIGGQFVALTATSNYSVQLQDGTEGVGKVLTSMTSDGKAQWAALSTNLTYFTEAQNTTAPNATVPVDSLTAVTATTNGDVAIVPKGTGAFSLAIPNGLATGGNKRGSYAVDFQIERSSSTQVSSGTNSFSAGRMNTSSGGDSASFGVQNTSSGNLGSFTAGWACVASGSTSIALGFGNQAINNYAVSLGSTNISSGGSSFSVNENNTASGIRSFVSGYYNTASGEMSTVTGFYSHSFGVKGRWVTGQGYGVLGDAQKSIFTLRIRTTDATPTILGIDSTTPSSINQVALQNNNSIRFKGTIIARQSGSTNTSAWDIDGIIQRGTSAATTTLLIGNVNIVQNTPAWGTPTLTANTTLGCLTVSVIGASATNIQWTCILDTTEVIYA